MTFAPRFISLSFVVAAAISAPLFSAPANAAEPPKEQDLIGVLQSDAPPQDKAITCKKLAVYGSKEAVPALAALLTNPELSSWARIALEAIPGPESDEALRSALSKTQGRLLIGVINSIGVRRDPQAVDGLIEKLHATDTDVAAAAADVLGRIGTDAAAQAVQGALTDTRPAVRASAAYGLDFTAENWLAQGKSAEAIKLYDTLRQAELPKQRILEATRGAILARGTAGIPLLLEQLKSPDIALVNVGLRTARELPGREVTDALAAELDQASADRQVPLLLALADRTDSSVLPKLLQVAQSSSKPVRATALGLLDKFRDLSSVPVLLSAACESDAQISAPAKTTLARLGGKEVDQDLLARLRLASGTQRQVLIDLAKQRRISDALPLTLRSTEDSDPGVRRAAIEAVGVLGSDRQVGDLVRLLSSTQKTDEREDIETALLSICGRNGARCLPQVLPLAKASDSTLRVVGLHALASVGGSEALTTLTSAISDSDSAVQDEAVRTLSNWPNTWPDDSSVAEPLLELAKSGKKPSYRVQGLQGYLQYVQDSKKLGNDEKLSKITELLPIIKTPEEQRSTISVLGNIPTGRSLQQLLAFADNSAVTEEMCQAILRIAGDRNQKDASVDLRRKALQTVVDKTENEAARKRASDLLKRLR